VAIYRLVNQTRNCDLAARLRVADTWLTRGLGLIVCSGLADGEGLWLPRTASIHTIGMRFSVDVVFVDAKLNCVGIKNQLGPWRIALGPAGASATIELRSGQLTKTRVNIGDQLALIPVKDE